MSRGCYWERLATAKILITGGAGFIGSHLAASLLEHGHVVHLLDNFARGTNDCAFRELRNTGAQFHERDLLQSGELNDLPTDYDTVYHLAAIIGVSNVLQRPYAVLRDNVLMTEKIIEFCRRQERLQRMVFASTSEVYAGTLKFFDLPIPTPESAHLAVTDLAQSRTSYMLSKMYGEAMCHQSGVSFTIVRPHNVYGPRMGMNHVIPELIQRARQSPEGGSLGVHSVDHRRTFCYIDDAVAMIRLAAEADSCRGMTLNIGSQFPEVSMGELAEQIIQIVGKPLSVHPLEETPGSPSRRCPDMRLTTSLTGYTAQVSLDKGIRSTMEWYRPFLNAGGS